MSSSNDPRHPNPQLAAWLARALREDPAGDEALDELLIEALGGDLSEVPEPPALDGPEPVLSDEDRQALAALGPDLVARLLKEERRRRARRARKSRRSRRELTGSLPRTEGEGDLTDKAREEIERRAGELEAEMEEGEQS
jgi:hypothetical protein